jgi:hypothetical protein
MVQIEHHEWLTELVGDINKKNITGALVECGVWRGGIVATMLKAQKKHSMDRHTYLYDTFDGMTPPTEKDLWTDNKKYRLRKKSWCNAPLEIVKDNLDEVKYDKSKIHYIVGDVCETLNDPANLPEEISILRLDTDFYNSTKKELDILFPRLSIGGYLIIDDYWAHKGCKCAVLEWFADNNGWPELEKFPQHKRARKKYRLSYRKGLSVPPAAS